jgi:hypothetical protein
MPPFYRGVLVTAHIPAKERPHAERRALLLACPALLGLHPMATLFPRRFAMSANRIGRNRRSRYPCWCCSCHPTRTRGWKPGDHRHRLGASWSVQAERKADWHGASWSRGSAFPGECEATWRDGGTSTSASCSGPTCGCCDLVLACRATWRRRGSWLSSCQPTWCCCMTCASSSLLLRSSVLAVSLPLTWPRWRSYA